MFERSPLHANITDQSQTTRKSSMGRIVFFSGYTSDLWIQEFLWDGNATMHAIAEPQKNKTFERKKCSQV